MIQYAWLIPLLPLAAFAVIIFFTGRNRLLSAGVAIAAMVLSTMISTGILLEYLANPIPVEYALKWIDITNLTVEMGVLIDGISVMMLFVVTFIATLIFIYSLGYMHDDPGFSRFFAYLSLFTFAMLGLVLANDFLQMFVFWELVGLASYLLIGFWFAKPAAAQAATRAFVVTRFGDFFLLLAILTLFAIFGTFNFDELAEGIAGYSNAAVLTVVAILVFLGPVGKSAQFPMHVWLPDAMEGPTPVSALIHAATMVAAGVYLVARTYFLFAASPVGLEVVAYIGGFTLVFASTIAFTQFDIKKILAYSTISQLGYMFLGLGVGGFTAGTFHLMTHAFFKALLFLGSGSVIIGLHHKQDIREMGGLYKKMPITTITFLVGALAIAGIYPLSGFWSKDAILAATLESGHVVLYGTAVIGAFMTAFYMFRLFFIAFMGEPRSEAHETSPSMTVPLVILGLFSIFVGLVGSPLVHDGFGHFIFYGEPVAEHLDPGIALTSNLVALMGIAAAWLIYGVKVLSLEPFARTFQAIYNLVLNKYYFDEIYAFLGNRVVEGISSAFHWHDKYIVDGVVHGVANLTNWTGAKLRFHETGLLQTYALVILSSVAVLVLLLAVLNPPLVLKLGGAL